MSGSPLTSLTLAAGKSVEISLHPERHQYLVASAPVTVNDVAAAARDGVAITGKTRLVVEAASDGDAELVLVDAR